MTLTNSSKTFRSASSFPHPHQQYVPSSLPQESQNVNVGPATVAPVVPIRVTITAHKPHSFITSYSGCPEPSMRNKGKT